MNTMAVVFIAMIIFCVSGGLLRRAALNDCRNMRVMRSSVYRMVIARMRLTSDALLLAGGICGYLGAQMLTGVAHKVLNAAAIIFNCWVVGFLLTKDYWWRIRAKRLAKRYENPGDQDD